jgi:hypothetical protein
MTFVLFLLSLLGFVALGVRRLSWPAEQMPLWTVALFISALYAAALSGVLYAGARVLVATGLILLVGQLVTDRHRLKEAAASVLTPGVCLFVAVAIAYWVKFHAGMLSAWDEFSHWGLVIKELTATHALSTPDSPVLFKDYPPGAGLFQYALMAVTGWSEGAAMVAQAMALWAVAPVLLTGATWRQGLRLVATIAVFYLLVVGFGHEPTSLYVDQVLGAWLVGVLAILWWSRDEGLGVLPRVLPMLAALPLIKTPGMALALTAAAYLALSAWTAPRSAEGRGRFGWRVVLVIALAAATPALAYGSWKHHVANAHFHETFRLTAQEPPETTAERRRVTIEAFGQALVQRPIGNMNARRTPPVTTVVWLAALLALLLAAWWGLKEPGQRARFLAMQGALGLGAIVYVGGLLWLYLTSFNAYEGPRLASFERYMGIYALIWSQVLVVHFVDAWGTDRRRQAVVAVVAVLVVGLLVRQGPYDGLSRLWAPTPGLSPVRQQLQAQVAGASGLAGRCYVVWQNTSGLEYWMLRYELAPHLTGQTDWAKQPWSLGAPYGPDDVWTRPLDARAWSDVLKQGFDYVLVGHADAMFTRRFGRLFERAGQRSPAGMYRVVPQADGWVKLHPVKPQAGAV